MFNIFKHNYKIVIDGNNSTEATQSIIDVLNYYGEVFDFELNRDVVETKTNTPVYKVHVLYVKATPRKFRRFKEAMLEIGHELTKIEDYYVL